MHLKAAFFMKQLGNWPPLLNVTLAMSAHSDSNDEAKSKFPIFILFIPPSVKMISNFDFRIFFEISCTKIKKSAKMFDLSKIARSSNERFHHNEILSADFTKELFKNA